MKQSNESTDLEKCASDGPQSTLERKFIEQFLAEKGYTLETIHQLPEEQARQIMVDACRYASLKLAEFESRAKFVDEIHLPS